MEKNQRPKRTSRRRLTIAVDAGLGERIKLAASARNMRIFTYIARVLEETVPRKRSRRISAEMIRKADELRRELKTPLLRDSVDLIREAREERDAHL
jgi:vacuolar-type H+-ATPase subunit C/Vma6